MGILTNLFGLYEGYKDFQQKQEKEGRTNFMETLAANQSVHPGDTSMNLTPEQAAKAKKYGINLDQLKQAGAPGPGQSAAQPQPQPGAGQAPQAQNPVMKILHGLTGGGQQQQPGQPQQVNYPSKGFATLNEQTGEVSPTRYIGAATDLIKTNATPKGITWLVSPDGKQEYQGHEGDPKTAELLQQGWQTQTKYGQDQGRMQHESDFQQKEKDIEAQREFNRNMAKDKPDTPNQDKQKRIDIEARKERGEPISVADATWAKGYDKVTQKATGQAEMPFEDRAPAEQKEIQDKAQAMIEGRMAVPAPYLRAREKTGVWNAALTLAMQTDPTFNESTYQTRAAVRKSFTSGKDSANVTSLNTAVGHIKTLKDKIAKLNNFGWFTYANSVKNLYNTKVSGSPAVKEFGEAATAVNNELATAFKGTSGTDQEVKEWRKGLDASDSPKQLNGVADTAIELLGSRIEKLREKYQEGMGTTTDMQVIRGNARKTLIELLGQEKVDAMDPPAQKQATSGTAKAGGAGSETKAGGKYADPNAVAADASLSKEDKLKILREQFGMK